MKLILAVRIADTAPQGAARAEDDEANTSAGAVRDERPLLYARRSTCRGYSQSNASDYCEGTIPWHAKQHLPYWGFCSFCPAQAGVLPNSLRRK